jgi:hypothetical protein
MGGAHDVLSVACLPFHHAGVSFVVQLGCLPPESNGTIGLFRPAFRPRKLDRQERRGAEPTGYDPATSRVTGGRAAHCATAPKRSVRCEWHGERMTTSPGSRVSCEIATHPPATARVAACCDTHMSHQLSKSWGRKCESPHPACAQVGRLTRPSRYARRPKPSAAEPPYLSARCIPSS